MMAARTTDPEQNWFFQQGIKDGRDGVLAIAPDEVRPVSAQRLLRRVRSGRRGSSRAWRSGDRERARRGVIGAQLAILARGSG